MADDRPSVSIGGIEFDYTQPDVSVDRGARTVEHELLSGDTVIQHMGTDPPEISMQGVCTRQETSNIDELPELGTIELVSPRWSGQVIVVQTETTPMGAKQFEDEGGHREWLHDFRINCFGIDVSTGGDGSGGGTNGDVAAIFGGLR